MTYLYLPNGCKWEFSPGVMSPFEAEIAAEQDYASALAYTNRLLALGASVNAPGLEAGEVIEEVNQLAHWLKTDNDGGKSHRVDFYVNHPKMISRIVSLYVRHEKEELDKFQSITGIDLRTAKMLPTKSPIEDKSNDPNGFILTLPSPIRIVIKLNPEFDETKPLGGGQPRRLFVRFDSVGTPTPAPQPAAAQPPANPFAGQQQPAVQPPKTAETNVYRVGKFQVNLSKGRVPQPYLIFAIGETEYAYSYTRQPFAEAGYDVTDWKNVGNHEMPCPAEITVEKHVSKDGKVADQWTVKSVKMIDLFAEAS